MYVCVHRTRAHVGVSASRCSNSATKGPRAPTDFYCSIVLPMCVDNHDKSVSGSQQPPHQDLLCLSQSACARNCTLAGAQWAWYCTMAAHALQNRLVNLSLASVSRYPGDRPRAAQMCRASKARRQPVVEECISAPLKVGRPISLVQLAPC